MNFTPSYELKIFQEATFQEELNHACQELKAIRTSGTFASFDQKKIAYEYYLIDKCRPSIIILHGFTEFCQKYYELTWYFTQMGYNVFLYDQRGHGKSQRLVEDLRLIHVDSYADYREDLRSYIDQIVLPVTEGHPLYLFSHSMGGTVSADYLATYPGIIKKAVLSSPMVVPFTHHVPIPFLLKEIDWRLKKETPTTRYCHASDFNPNPNPSLASDVSRPRFQNNMAIRLSDPIYQSSSSTNQWMKEALTRKKPMYNYASKINIPMLIMTAGKDHVVKNKYTRHFAKLVPNATLSHYPEARHSIYGLPSEALEKYVREILDFLH